MCLTGALTSKQIDLNTVSVIHGVDHFVGQNNKSVLSYIAERSGK